MRNLRRYIVHNITYTYVVEQCINTIVLCSTHKNIAYNMVIYMSEYKLSRVYTHFKRDPYFSICNAYLRPSYHFNEDGLYWSPKGGPVMLTLGGGIRFRF